MTCSSKVKSFEDFEEKRKRRGEDWVICDIDSSTTNEEVKLPSIGDENQLRKTFWKFLDAKRAAYDSVLNVISIDDV